MNNSKPILTAESVSKSFDGKKIIDNINITLAEGEIVSLLGVSGSGKSTLFNIISGIMPPDSGEVFLKGEIITAKPGKISYMLQKDLLFEHKKIIDNISLPLVLKGVPANEARSEALRYFEAFGLTGTADKYPCVLSGGMRQRAAFLRTYLASDSVALLDEPFSALDTITKATIHSWYLDIMEKIRLSTVFITHDIDEAILLSDRIYILSGQPSCINNELIVSTARSKRRGFELTDEFIAYKKQIVDILSSEMI